MAIPLAYNVRSVTARWASVLVAVLGIAGTVGVFVAMLAMARGFRATLIASGSPENAMIRRAGASSEMESAVDLDQVRVIESAAAVAREDGTPLVCAEVVVIAALPMKSTGTDANVQVRGTSPRALMVRPDTRILEGRFFEPGLNEIVVGKNALQSYAGLDVGGTLDFGGTHWQIVGSFDTGGSAFDSEIWCDARVLNAAYKRPESIFQSVTVRLVDAAAFDELKDSLTSDPRLTVQVDREIDYYAEQSGSVTAMIQALGFLVAFIMGIGAVFGALNTMYSAVAERAREIATLRALGFPASSVVLSFVVESLLIAFVGGLLGCVLVLPMNGYTTGTMNWQTFSHLAFAFQVTPGLMLEGVVFALLMGLIGGVPPAIKAARERVAVALRAL